MTEPSGRDLISEWRQVMETVISGAAGAAAAAGRSDIPREMVRASQRQLELMQQLVDSERRRVDVLFGPAQAAFDLLADSGATLRKQAEAMESAGEALQDTAALMKQQAELLEKVIGLMRQPTDIARAAARGARGGKGGSAEDTRRGAAGEDDGAKRENRSTKPKTKTAKRATTTKRRRDPDGV